LPCNTNSLIFLVITLVKFLTYYKMNITQLHNKGNHLIIDGISTAKIESKEFISKFLTRTTKQIKMKAISKPFVLHHKAKVKSESGITGVIILAESNITIHTYPEKKQIYLDLFSCNEFPIEKTIKYIVKELKITKYKKKILKRSIKWNQ